MKPLNQTIHEKERRRTPRVQVILYGGHQNGSITNPALVTNVG